jgi:thiosulfate/3-mercaptopyruvate sulfurtransferase
LENAEPQYIPKTRVFDLEEISDHESHLPHMIPAAAQFEKQVRALGINETSKIVVYDLNGIFSSPRIRWMFKAMGHETVAILDGGLPAWTKAVLPTETSPVKTALNTGNFLAKSQGGFYCDADEVEEAHLASGFKILDARSRDRFMGVAPEPRPGLRAGHIPGSLNLPFTEVLVNGALRPKEELAQIFRSLASPQDQLIFTCGSGVTACIIGLAAEVAGYSRIKVYDGSWSEWGLPSNRPCKKNNA